MSNTQPGDESIAARFGAQLHALRSARGLTLDALAVQTGVSKAMLSRLERGAASPTITLVARIAQGLDVTFGHLVGEEDRNPAVYVPAAKRLELTDPETGVIQHLFPALTGASLEFRHLTLPPGTSTGPRPPHRRGRETYVVVDRGQLHATMDGTDYVLSEEDVLFFDGSVVHAFSNRGSEECHCFLIGTRPKD